LAATAGVLLVTWIATRVVPVNATTVGFAYLLLVLIIASVWGFVEAFLASLAATLTFNFFFLPPVGKLTITDPQNVVALFSFLASSLVASRLSTQARQRALDALTRQQDLERLYTFSRAILLIGKAGEPFPKQLVLKLAEVFEFAAVVLFDRRAEEFYRAGPSDFEGMDEQLREAALQGTSFEVDDAKTGEEALEKLRDFRPELVLLDINMPGMGGLAACRAIRAALRRLPLSPSAPNRIRVGELTINFGARTVTQGSTTSHLTPKELDLLRYLTNRANEAVPHRELLQAVWGPDYGDRVDYLRAFIRNLRKKIEVNPENPNYILTEPWMGYRFNGTVEVL